MGNVNDGASGDSGNGSERRAIRDEPEVKRENEEKRGVSEDCGCEDEHAPSEVEGDDDADARREARELAPYIIDAIVENEESLNRLFIERSEIWSGLLPDPESFSKYPDFAQRKMIDWNDAQIIDESKRNDKIIEAAIKQLKWGQILSFLVNVLSIAAAFWCFNTTGNAASFGFLAVPGAAIVVNIGLKIHSAQQSQKNDRQD